MRRCQYTQVLWSILVYTYTCRYGSLALRSGRCSTASRKRALSLSLLGGSTCVGWRVGVWVLESLGGLVGKGTQTNDET